MASKTQSHGSSNVCPICCKAILDATKTKEGQEALECENIAKNGYIAGALESTSKTTQFCLILVTLGHVPRAV